MNNVQAFIDRQVKNYTWKSYDTAIKMLRCREEDDFNRISSIGNNEDPEPPVFACKFAEKSGCAHILGLANEDGVLAIHNTECISPMESRYAKEAHYNAIFDIAWMNGHMKIVTVSGDHTARLFDVATSEIIEERIFHGHTRSVKTVAFRKDDPAVFATGARDGAIYVWDTRANNHFSYITQPDCVISNSHNMPATPRSASKSRKKWNCNVSGANSVTSLVFQDDLTLISCGAGDGAIKVWDLRKHYGIHKREPLPKNSLRYMGNTARNGFTNLLVDCSGLKLYANCMDNTIYCYNIATYQQEPYMIYTGHQNSSFYIKSSISSDGQYLVSGSSDNNAYIWNTNKSTPLISLVGHTAEVTCVAWCQKPSLKIVTCADDMKHKIWRIYDSKSPDNWEIEGRGSAIELPETTAPKQLCTPSRKRSIILTTPHSQKKRSKTCEKCQMSTPGSLQSLANCENCIYTSRKRTSSQADLSPGNELSQPKKQDKSGARRLFGHSPESSDSSDHILATILEEKSPERFAFSPTANLPNFVLNGDAPHLKNFSPQKKKDKDWLTKMCIEKQLRSQMDELSRPPSPKQRRFSDSTNITSPKVSKKAKKCNTPTSSTSPLLKFFRITSNSNTRGYELQCSPVMNSTIQTELR